MRKSTVWTTLIYANRASATSAKCGCLEIFRVPIDTGRMAKQADPIFNRNFSRRWHTRDWTVRELEDLAFLEEARGNDVKAADLTWEAMRRRVMAASR